MTTRAITKDPRKDLSVAKLVETSSKAWGREFTADKVELLERALDTAITYHDGQERNSGEPYVYHVFETACNVARYGLGATTIAAALLHDTLEDTSLTEDELRAKFGDEITSLVQGVTKLGKLKYQGRDRHVESLRKFFIASAADVRVVIIKLCDRLHNLQTLDGVRPDKRPRIALESIEIYAPLAGRLGMAKLSGELQDAAFPYAYPEEYQKLMTVMSSRAKKNEEMVEKLFKKLKRILSDNGIANSTTHRIKGVFSLYKKMTRKGYSVDEVSDMIALRVLVDTPEDCYRALGIIHAHLKPVPGRIKDFIALPKPNGYQSLHTTVFTGDGGVAEIQIRTHKMHEQSEFGIAAHFAYKNSIINIDTKKEKYHALSWLSDLSDLKSESKDPDSYLKSLKTDFFEDRIFVFTPKGDVIDLPHGSTGIDFAYAVHTDIGDHAHAITINGKYSSLKTELHSNDVVHVEVDPKAKPSYKLLPFAKTSFAKRNLRNKSKEASLFMRFFK
ncbi:MAG TPA: RelA/SpoT family protein [Candidatus Paceibacterota bacterium]